MTIPDEELDALFGKTNMIGKVVDQYQADAEQAYKAKLIVGKGDPTFRVKDQLKSLGCKWHATRHCWVAGTQEMLNRAIDIVNRGQPDPPSHPAGRHGTKSPTLPAYKFKLESKTGEWMVGEPIPAPENPVPADLEQVRAALLVELEQRRLIELAPGRIEQLLNGAPATEDELLQGWSKTDEAFRL